MKAKSTLTNSTLSGNSAPSDGGALSTYGGTVTVNGTTFSGNSAGGPPGSTGRAIVIGSGFTMTNSILTGDTGGEVTGPRGQPSACPGPMGLTAILSE